MPEPNKSKWQIRQDKIARQASKEAYDRKQQAQREAANKASQRALKAEQERQARVEQAKKKWEQEQRMQLLQMQQQEQARREAAQAALWEQQRQTRLQRNAAEMPANSGGRKNESDWVEVETVSFADMSLEDGPLNYVPGADEDYKKVNVNNKEIPTKFAKVASMDPEASQAGNAIPSPTSRKTAATFPQLKQAPSATGLSIAATVPATINVDYDDDFMERPFTSRDEEKSVTFLTSPLSQATYYTTNSNLPEGSIKAASVQQSSNSVASHQSSAQNSQKAASVQQSSSNSVASRQSCNSGASRQSRNSVASRQSRVPSVSDSSNSNASQGSRTRAERARAREEMKTKHEALEKKDSSDISL